MMMNTKVTRNETDKQSKMKSDKFSKNDLLRIMIIAIIIIIMN